ncbi:MAG: AraC family transcriptional regulator [Butyrivibrio sp.]|uniref:helix-turn-helix domain-containing protein n=1 Tax=Butyrivibrio sp. NC2002 TaxID=1410610 RepID=UPI000566EEC8|nr:helix-turn-helix domain-containing protein [Butyrivibrio sp. NC2002]MBE5860469.1 AraC family transcriptional regulator [Butyrivibrio sp.]
MFRTDYCGYNVHNPNKDSIYRPEGRGDYLFLHITSDMDFYFPREKKDKKAVYKYGMSLTKVRAKKGDCILYTPGYFQYYCAVSAFSNSFVHFTCDEDEIRGIQIPMNNLFHPVDDEAIVDTLRRLQFEYLSKQQRREKMIDLLIRELLIAAERSISIPTSEVEKTEVYASLSRFRVGMLQRCSEEWDIEKICKETNLGRSQLYHYYKAFFFTTPKDDLINARIDKAKHLLSNKELRISEVAEQSGFTNIYHFNRYFKRECGCTPSKYRLGFSIFL